MEIFHLKKFNDVAFKKQYQTKISNRFTTLVNLSDDANDVDISRAWEGIRL